MHGMKRMPRHLWLAARSCSIMLPQRAQYQKQSGGGNGGIRNRIW